MISPRWDCYFLKLAKITSEQSKDPSTRCGAIVVRPNRTVASVGFNGFPQKCRDDPELYADRVVKLERIIHAEMNALLFAREPLHGYTIYIYPIISCARCAAHIIQAGITRVIYPEKTQKDFLQRRPEWVSSMEIALGLYREAGVIVQGCVESTTDVPYTYAVSIEEGGDWEPFFPGKHVKGNKVHAIKFSDGSIWDAFNGWRQKR